MEKRTPTWTEYDEVQKARNLLCYHCRIEQNRPDPCTDCAVNQVLKSVFQSLPEEETVHLIIGTNPQVCPKCKEVSSITQSGPQTIFTQQLIIMKAVSSGSMSDWKSPVMETIVLTLYVTNTDGEGRKSTTQRVLSGIRFPENT